MSEETCSDSKEFCSYMKDIYLSAEYRHGCVIPKDPNQGYSSFSRVTDTLDSGDCLPSLIVTDHQCL